MKVENSGAKKIHKISIIPVIFFFNG